MACEHPPQNSAHHTDTDSRKVRRLYFKCKEIFVKVSDICRRHYFTRLRRCTSYASSGAFDLGLLELGEPYRDFKFGGDMTLTRVTGRPNLKSKDQSQGHVERKCSHFDFFRTAFTDLEPVGLLN